MSRFALLVSLIAPFLSACREPEWLFFFAFLSVSFCFLPLLFVPLLLLSRTQCSLTQRSFQFIYLPTYTESTPSVLHRTFPPSFPSTQLRQPSSLQRAPAASVPCSASISLIGSCARDQAEHRRVPSSDAHTRRRASLSDGFEGLARQLQNQRLFSARHCETRVGLPSQQAANLLRRNARQNAPRSCSQRQRQRHTRSQTESRSERPANAATSFATFLDCRIISLILYIPPCSLPRARYGPIGVLQFGENHCRRAVQQY